MLCRYNDTKKKIVIPDINKILQVSSYRNVSHPIYSSTLFRLEYLVFTKYY